jgi:hypothetical protein
MCTHMTLLLKQKRERREGKEFLVQRPISLGTSEAARRQLMTQGLRNKVPSNYRCYLDFVALIGSVTEGDCCDYGTVGCDVCSCRW